MALTPALIPTAGPVTGYRIQGRAISGTTLAAAALALALMAVVPRRLWRRARLGVTAVHESGHAAVALVVGRKVSAINLRPDSSGVTVHYGAEGRGRRALTAAAGYPAPGLLGLGGAWLLAHRALRVWLLVLVVLGVVNVVFWIRNLFGWVVMCAWLGGVGWLMVRGSAGVDALVGAVAVWYLVLGGLRAALELPRAPAASDAADLGRLLHLPGGVCKAAFIVVAAAPVLLAAGGLSAAR